MEEYAARLFDTLQHCKAELKLPESALPRPRREAPVSGRSGKTVKQVGMSASHHITSQRITSHHIASHHRSALRSAVWQRASGGKRKCPTPTSDV